MKAIDSNGIVSANGTKLIDVQSCDGIQFMEESSEEIDDTKTEKYRLELILGPMTGGKSTFLGNSLKLKSLYKRVLAVNTTKDKRYGNEGIITHDGHKIAAIRVDNLYELLSMKEYKEAEVVGIDEGNFFPEINDFIREQLEMTSKSFIVAALNGDKNMELFGNVHLLIPRASFIHFVTALCRRCADGTTASYSAALQKFEGQEKVGGSETYEAVCERHYHFIKYTQSLDSLKSSRNN